MAHLDWTYELPPVGAPATGLEEYVVVGPSGEDVGKVLTLLRRDGKLWLAVETGSPPITRERRALPWDQVREVDHDTLTVVLAVGPDELADADLLDPSNGVEQVDEEHADVDAVRVAELPEALRPPPGPPGPDSGPVDRPVYAGALLVGGIGIFTLLIAVIVAAATSGGWGLALFAVPAFLLAAAFVIAYRAWRLPYEQRRRS